MRGIAVFFVGLIAITLLGCGSLSRGPGLIKVLPHYLDEHGRHTVGVTLIERDLYQLELRKDPKAVHGVRYNVNWRGNAEMLVRLELRSTKAGVAPLTLEQTATPEGGDTWTPILIDLVSYKKFGQPESWRVTLWQNGEQVAEQASFLW
ncbi:MAG: hypothetical protein H8E27_05785 [Verrucomicrobia subdivision 3 bacterium]|nr:hypothetical protein [Limisphaerales bacterium]